MFTLPNIVVGIVGFVFPFILVIAGLFSRSTAEESGKQTVLSIIGTLLIFTGFVLYSYIWERSLLPVSLSLLIGGALSTAIIAGFVWLIGHVVG